MYADVAYFKWFHMFYHLTRANQHGIWDDEK